MRTAEYTYRVGDRVRHVLWPVLGVGTIVELITVGRKNPNPRYARVRWDNYGDGRAMKYDIGSLRPATDRGARSVEAEGA